MKAKESEHASANVIPQTILAHSKADRTDHTNVANNRTIV